MSTLITGHRGFIGTKLWERLRNKEVLTGIDLRAGQNLLTCPLPKNGLYYETEMNSSIDVIYHLAAQSSVEDSWKDPTHDSMNLAMTVRLAQAYPDAKIIYANSAASLTADSPYGFSKKVAGDYLKKFHKNTVSLVFPNIYGEGSRSVVDIFKGEEQVWVYGDGLQTRSYVHVDDIVRGLDMAKDWKAGEYFMGNGEQTTVLDLAKGKKVIHEPARKEARESVLPNTSPNWVPRIGVMEYLNSKEGAGRFNHEWCDKHQQHYCPYD